MYCGERWCPAMTELYSPAAIREAEARAVACGISEIELMGRAAEGILRALPATDLTVGILCGKGNNAGDGYALAHLLAKAGRPVILYCLEEKRTAAAAHYYALCKAAGIPEYRQIDSPAFAGCGLLVDCIFGTGFRGTVGSPYREVIEAANASGLPVVAADIPSGLSAVSGLGDCVIRATKTVAIGGYKYGHFLGRGRDVCGQLSLWDIGLHPLSGASLIEPCDVAHLFAPRPHHCHKGSFGTAVILGGSLPYSGAPRLSMLAASALQSGCGAAELPMLAASALRSGCGIARLALPASLTNAALPYLLEGTLCPMPHHGGSLICDRDALSRAFAGVAAAAIGMGMGRSPEITDIVRWALEALSIPLVIDADGLNALADTDLSYIVKSKCAVVLTPHPKEFSRLSGIPMADVLADPVAHAVSFAKAHHCTVLLKGTGTVISDGDRTYVMANGSGGMATAGSGDVLAGVLAGLLAWESTDLPLTVAAGALICGLAGELAAQTVGTVSMVASDTVNALPAAILSVASVKS